MSRAGATRKLLILAAGWVALNHPVRSQDEVLQLPIGDAARAQRQAIVRLDAITDTSRDELIPVQSLVSRLADARVLFIGEEHTNGEFHRVQLQVIRALHAAGRKVVIGLEMFPYTTTKPLARWSAGKLSETAFIDESRWYETWSHHWGHYRDIFLFAREQKLRLVGINAPREVVRTVRSGGFDALDPESRRHLPPSIDTSSQEHRRLFRAYFEADDPLHSNMPPEQLEAMYLSQLTWDASMGWNAVQALGADPSEIVVVLIGSGHVAYDLGAARQLRAHFSSRVASLIPVSVRDSDGKPVDSVRASYADYLWGLPSTAQPTLPMLGVSLMGRTGKEPTKIIQIDRGSTAEQHGLKVGDIIRKLDGTAIASTADLQRRTGSYGWGDGAQLLIERDGQPLTVAIVFRRKS